MVVNGVGQWMAKQIIVVLCGECEVLRKVRMVRSTRVLDIKEKEVNEVQVPGA